MNELPETVEKIIRDADCGVESDDYWADEFHVRRAVLLALQQGREQGLEEAKGIVKQWPFSSAIIEAIDAIRVKP